MSDHPHATSSGSHREANDCRIPGDVPQSEHNRPSDTMKVRTNFRSFDPRIAHLGFEERLHHNLEIELAKPDRTRTLNALNCRALYLRALIPAIEKRNISSLLTSYATFVLKSARATQELMDVEATLDILARRTLCQAMVCGLPREIRDMVYMYLMRKGPVQMVSLATLGDQVQVCYKLIPSFVRQMALMSRSQNMACRQYCVLGIDDSTVMGRDSHQELISLFFETRQFVDLDFRKTEITTMDPWNYGIDPRQAIRHLRIICWEQLDKLDKEIFSKTTCANLKRVLERRGIKARWTVEVRDSEALNEESPYLGLPELDVVFQGIVGQLDNSNIPNPESITLKLNPFCLIMNRTYEAPLDAWIDMYQQTAAESHIKDIRERIKLYESLKETQGKTNKQVNITLTHPCR